jgi:hypothetical protein
MSAAAHSNSTIARSCCSTTEVAGFDMNPMPGTLPKPSFPQANIPAESENNKTNDGTVFVRRNDRPALRTPLFRVRMGRSRWPSIVASWEEMVAMKHAVAFCFMFGSALGVAQDGPPGSRDGEVRTVSDSQFVAWDAVAEAWVDPEAFWVSYASRGEGRHWPGGGDYPPYAEVGEHDTFLVQTQIGPCLMYFFHGRWRRANDVRRWGDQFNDYGGCPQVFD